MLYVVMVRVVLIPHFIPGIIGFLPDLGVEWIPSAGCCLSWGCWDP